MKTLLLLRHAKSSWKHPGLADHDRPLNGRGRRDAPRVGRLLRERGVRADRVLCSTAARARTTAEGVIEAAKLDCPLEPREELYQAAPGAVIDLLGTLDGAPACVMVVGHNPTLEALVAALTGVPTTMPTAALARIELDIDRWQDLADHRRGAGTRPGRLTALWRPDDQADRGSTGT